MRPDLVYSNCPVPNALLLVLRRFRGELERRGLRFALLPPDRADVHFTFAHPRYFRFGGEIPPLISEGVRAPGRTRLIGLTRCRTLQGFFVLCDSDIVEPADLKGKRIALTSNAIRVLEHLEGVSYETMEPWEQTQLALGTWEARALIHTLNTAGLTPTDVEWVPVPNPWAAHAHHAARASSSFAPQDLFPDAASPEGNAQVAALVERRVDAIFSFLPYAAELERRAIARPVLDLRQFPEDDYVSTWTVSRQLVEEDPEVVQTVVRLAVAAGRWAANHPDEVAAIHAENLGVSVEAVWRAFGPRFHEQLVPCLDPALIETLDRTQAFLLEHNLLPRAVKLEEWIEPSFLQRVRC